MAGGLDKLAAPGRHTRRQRRAGLRRVSVVMLIMLVVQYGLGIFLNFYVAVPASDAHAGIFQQIATAGERNPVLAVLATAGLTAIGGAFGAGEIFVKNGQDTASLAMAILTGVALLCYVGLLALAPPAQSRATAPELVAPVRMPRPRTPARPAEDWPAGY